MSEYKIEENIDVKEDEYRCSVCHKVFQKGQTDEEALKEKEDIFPGIDVEDCDLVCDDCFEEMDDEFKFKDKEDLKMYKQVETDRTATLENGSEFSPVATLIDGSGGRCQISIDDHCYILRLKQENGRYRTTAWIFAEAFEVLRRLPSLETFTEKVTL